MAHYQKIQTPSKSFPRLVIERSEVSPEEMIGFLELGQTGKRIVLGNPNGREFRLMQCLFSPKNFMSAKYEPVVQTHERVFSAIGVKADTLNKRLSSRKDADSEMTAIVERSMRVLQKGEVGKHFSFHTEEGRVRMEITPVGVRD